jgi:hypothetical protein
VEKQEFLNLSRAPAELELMRKLKALLDPCAIPNDARVTGTVNRCDGVGMNGQGGAAY